MPENIPLKEIDVTEKPESPGSSASLSRRKLLEFSAKVSTVSLLGAATLLSGCDDSSAQVSWAENFQKAYRLMSADEVAAAIKRLEARYSEHFSKAVSVDSSKAEPGVLFGAALNLQKCIGCRRCVKACTLENNQSRTEGEETEWIRVLKMEQEPTQQEDAEHYYQSESVPQQNAHYMPISCMQCENPPCVKVCPVQATYREDDGIVVVDYNWCIGCRMCIQACPYWARRFNWREPGLSSEQLNPNTHYLGNRPRMKGVVEKCTFCIQRVRKGRNPACVEACPVGARKFGNLLDENSEIRKVLASKRVFRLKEELNTEPKFFYFAD
ncbi:prokaryotic molybdopterin-containing oxidoreductase family, iron-sulfur binding subunit [Alteromonadaceae bacterium Bs31]|nr:prokaryotic molybdopterin-containing oxidoreductase family, iron-sulfur binding subunit [Alteromonadaceae bacterium Bs31]